MIQRRRFPPALGIRLNANDLCERDVIIVGAGPAGTTAAYRIAAAGHSVLLLDKKAFPREKVCGDGLIPDALRALRSLGLYDRVRETGHLVRQLTIMSPSGIRINIPSECVTLRREILDALLLERAADAGADFRVGNVIDVIQTDGETVSVSVEALNSRLRARIVLLATGADVRLLGRLGMLRRSSPSAVALRCYVRSPVESNELLVSFDRSIAPGYAWIFPMGGQEYNVGCGVFYQGRGSQRTNLRTAFDRFSMTPVARRLLREGQVMTPLRGARLRAGLSGAALGAHGRIIPIGETIGTTYPYTGEGIGKAMETAAIAARQINLALSQESTEPLEQIGVALKQDIAPKYVGYRIAQKWISRPWLSDLLAARIRANSALQEATAGILDETTDPRRVFSWRNLAPSWRRQRSGTAGSTRR